MTKEWYKLNLYNVLKEVPRGTTTIKDDEEKIIRGERNRLIITGLPGDGKTTTAEYIGKEVVEKSDKLVIINEIFDKKQYEAKLARADEYKSNPLKFWDTVSEEVFESLNHLKPKNNVAEIILLPAFGAYNLGKTAVEKIADGINKGTEAWEKGMIYCIAPSPKSDFYSRIEARKEKHALVQKYKNGEIEKNVFLKKISNLNLLPPIDSLDRLIKPPPQGIEKEAQPRKMGKHRMGFVISAAKTASEQRDDKNWLGLLNNIIIPDTLNEKRGKTKIDKEIYSYKKQTGLMVKWLNDLKLDPNRAKVIANPQLY